MIHQVGFGRFQAIAVMTADILLSCVSDPHPIMLLLNGIFAVVNELPLQAVLLGTIFGQMSVKLGGLRLCT